MEGTVHETVNQKASWGMEGVKGWYIGPTFEHCRCYKIYISSMREDCIAVALDFHPQSSELPYVSAADAATNAVKDLTVE
eukprot:1800181-Ditylum_brightwellii.AAC.2